MVVARILFYPHSHSFKFTGVVPHGGGDNEREASLVLLIGAAHHSSIDVDNRQCGIALLVGVAALRWMSGARHDIEREKQNARVGAIISYFWWGQFWQFVFKKFVNHPFSSTVLLRFFFYEQAKKQNSVDDAIASHEVCIIFGPEEDEEVDGWRTFSDENCW